MIISINIAEEKCNACGTCANQCPNSVFKVDKKCRIAKLDDCMACRLCEAICPQMAIEVLE